MKKLIFSLLFLFVAWFAHADVAHVLGQPGKYETYITAFGKMETKDIKFFIEPADENISPNDLEFKEYAKYVAAYFEMWGAKQVDEIKQADVFILVDFGIGETKPLIYHNPIWGRTGVSSQETTYYKNSTYTSYSYDYGVVGYNTEEIDQYRKYINLHVYKQNEDKNPTPVWKAEIVCTSSGSNLAGAIPVMMWNARYQIGENRQDVRNFPCKIDNKEWADWEEYNHFSAYISKNTGEPLHGFATDWTFWGKTAKTLLYPQALYYDKNYCYVIFYCPVYNIYPLSMAYEYKIPTNTYIEYDGKKYQANKSYGFEFDKKNKNPYQRTFTIRFERLPDDAIRNEISIYSDVKGKRKYGWENIYIY